MTWVLEDLVCEEICERYELPVVSRRLHAEAFREIQREVRDPFCITEEHISNDDDAEKQGERLCRRNTLRRPTITKGLLKASLRIPEKRKKVARLLSLTCRNRATVDETPDRSHEVEKRRKRTFSIIVAEAF
jgi:hypothetical protein